MGSIGVAPVRVSEPGVSPVRVSELGVPPVRVAELGFSPGSSPLTATANLIPQRS